MGLSEPIEGQSTLFMMDKTLETKTIWFLISGPLPFTSKLMNLFKFIAAVVRFALRLVLWTVAALVSMAVVSVLVVALLCWALVSLALGRRPNVGLRGRFDRMRQFSGAFGSARFKASASWPTRAKPSKAPESKSASPLARRMAPPEAVMDVEVKDLSDKRQGH